MISTDNRIAAFVGLSEFLRSPENEQEIDSWVEQAYLANNWFTPANVRYALESIALMLGDPVAFLDWFASYEKARASAKIGVVMAGNIPLVGFHDLLCVLISGHRLLVKPSKDDTALVKLVVRKICELEPAFVDYVQFVDRINEADAYIATGSDNTARYFEYYFSSKPHIIRKNRVSVAVLTGRETGQELDGLCADIFRYFGLGCRNVSKLFVPEGYDFTGLYERAEAYRDYAANHHKYFNNYEYNKSILLVNGDRHFDNGFLLIGENDGFVSPLSMVYYKEYDEPGKLKEMLEPHRGKIQCIAGNNSLDEQMVPFGETQRPGLSDYADGADVMKFLSRLN